MGPFGYAFHRVLETTLGSVIGVAVSVLIAPARADLHLYQATAELDCALRSAVRRPSQQSISLDPRGNTTSYSYRSQTKFLRHGFVFEETGSGFSRANLGRFQLQCLGVAEASSSLDAHLRPIRHLLESGELPYLHEALERSRQAVVRSFHSPKHLQISPVCQRLDEQLRQLLISARVGGLTYHCESPTALSWWDCLNSGDCWPA